MICYILFHPLGGAGLVQQGGLAQGTRSKTEERPLVGQLVTNYSVARVRQFNLQIHIHRTS